MSAHLALKSKRITVALALILSSTGSAWALPAGDGTATAPNSGAAASASAATTAGAPDPAKAGTASKANAKPAEAASMETALSAANPGFPLETVLPPPPGAQTQELGGAQSQQLSGEQNLARRIDTLERSLNTFGPFSFAGDVRVRDEDYSGGPINDSQDRNRERYRARFYINAKLNDDLFGGLGLSTGDLNDPITSNQTANQFFTRKPFALDRAFIDYTPHQWKALTLIGGKFAYPWYRTQLTWDDDIYPEGVAEKLEWKSDNWHVLRQIAFIGFQLPFAETQNPEAIRTSTQPVNAILPYPNGSIRQSVVYGGQIQTRWQLGKHVSFLADTAFYNYQ